MKIKLTPSQRRVNHFILLGWSHQEIADHLCISKATVNYHSARILAKVGYSSKYKYIVDHYIQNGGFPPELPREDVTLNDPPEPVVAPPLDTSLPKGRGNHEF